MSGRGVVRGSADSAASAHNTQLEWYRRQGLLPIVCQELPAFRRTVWTTLLFVVVWWLIVAVSSAASPDVYSESSRDTSVSGQFSGSEHANDRLLPLHDDRRGLARLPDVMETVAMSEWDQQLTNSAAANPAGLFDGVPMCGAVTEGWYVLPRGLLYRSYLAGIKEPRIQWASLHDSVSDRRLWETALGGRAGLIRYGSPDTENLDGFQFDLEGGVFARVLPDEPSSMLEAADFRFGFFGTWRFGRMAYRTGYYHISSHVGDEFLQANPLFDRINYVRDSIIVSAMYDLTDSMQIYGEIGNAVGAQGGAKPLELQFGAQYVPVPANGFRGAPFAAVNGHLRQDFDFGGSINVMTGWNWQGAKSGSRFRIGMQYFNGPSMQYSFFDRHENLLGGGMWFDF